jgi:hypothetical protein
MKMQSDKITVDIPNDVIGQYMGITTSRQQSEILDEMAFIMGAKTEEHRFNMQCSFIAKDLGPEGKKLIETIAWFIQDDRSKLAK